MSKINLRNNPGTYRAGGMICERSAELALMPGVVLHVRDNLFDAVWYEDIRTKLPGLRAQIDEWVRAGGLEVLPAEAAP